jgi:two-component system phosphate regulon sensor histidine kinase PhoR
MIAAQTQRLSQIADQFLVASRLETGELPIASEAVDVVELARETVEAMGSRAPTGPPIELTFDDAVSPAHVDPHRLRQVLVNLLDNAIKYSPQGHPVNVSVESRERRIRLSVSDRGRGIPRSQHSRIFEKFYRLDPDLAQGAGGTGLGLYICRELVERMGGRIGLESVEGRGSTFFVDLPRAGS